MSLGSSYSAECSSSDLSTHCSNPDGFSQDQACYLNPDMWTQIFPEFFFCDLLCQTGSSVIWLGYEKGSLRLLALKISEIADAGSSVFVHQQRQKAFILQNELKHRVKVFSVKEQPCFRLLAMEYCPWSLADVLKHYTQFPNRSYTQSHLNFIAYAFNCILNAVEELHRLGYVHRDLKPDNFMIDQSFNIYLNDFELVTKQLEIDNSLSGTLEYMAPQRLCKKKRNEPIKAEVDVWSLGIILYQLFTGMTPFNGQSEEQILDEIYENYINPRQIPLQALQLTKLMLQLRSDKRPRIQQIRSSAFLQSQVDMNAIKYTLDFGNLKRRKES